MTPEQLHILQHSLGVNEYSEGTQYRNRFVTDQDSSNGKLCRSLVELGYMKDSGAVPLFGGMHTYWVTREGKEAMLKESPPPPKLTRSQRRYRAFLKADLGISFGDFLKLRSPL